MAKQKTRVIIVITVFPSRSAVGLLAVEGKPGYVWTRRNTVYHEKEWFAFRGRHNYSHPFWDHIQTTCMSFPMTLLKNWVLFSIYEDV